MTVPRKLAIVLPGEKLRSFWKLAIFLGEKVIFSRKWAIILDKLAIVWEKLAIVQGKLATVLLLI